MSAIQVEMSPELIALLHQSNQPVDRTAREFIVLELFRRGSISSGKAGELLGTSYVSVYVDTDTAAGKALAGEFGLSQGLVISSRGGKYQALRHTGTVTPEQLTGYLTSYNGEAVALTTADVGAVPAIGYTAGYTPAVGGCPGGVCGVQTAYTGYAGGIRWWRG